MIASPIGGGNPSVTVVTSPRRMGAAAPGRTTMRSRSRAVVTALRCAIANRWFGVSMNPPVSAETPLRAAAITSASVTALACSRSGSTSTCSCRSRWPHTATLATPGTAISRGRIVQSATVVISICESVFDVTPILSARLSDESGDSSTGALATAGRPRLTRASRSCTSWRACIRSAP